VEIERARLLGRRALQVAEMFSRKDRGGNPMGEQFSIAETIILSETTAAVVFDKSSGKQGVAWFYYINSRAKPRWEYFFVTYSHLVGLNHVADLLHRVEQHNYQVSIGEYSGQEETDDPETTPPR
jgi:hypothetical protein